MNTSLKDLAKRVDKEQRILKSNQKTIDINNKEIAYLIDNANITGDVKKTLDPIIVWLEEMIKWEQESLRIRTLKAYAQFHNGRISGMQLSISLLKTIIKNQN
jgi:hypothetical protein